MSPRPHWVSGIAAATALDEPSPARRAGDLVRAEWIKMRSLRSTWWMVALSAIATVGIAALTANSDLRDMDRSGFDPLSDSFIGMLISQLVFATLGVLTISDEYTSGLIRSTFTVTPQRMAVLAAKATVVGALTLVTGGLSAVAAFGTAQTILSSQNLGISLTAPGALPAITAATGYLVTASLIGLGLGTLLRGTAPAVCAAVVLLFLAPELLRGTAPWVTTLANTLPADAIRRLVAGTVPVDAPSATQAIVVILAYPLLILMAAAVRLRRRDTGSSQMRV